MSENVLVSSHSDMVHHMAFDGVKDMVHDHLHAYKDPWSPWSPCPSALAYHQYAAARHQHLLSFAVKDMVRDHLHAYKDPRSSFAVIVICCHNQVALSLGRSLASSASCVAMVESCFSGLGEGFVEEVSSGIMSTLRSKLMRFCRLNA